MSMATSNTNYLVTLSVNRISVPASSGTHVTRAKASGESEATIIVHHVSCWVSKKNVLISPYPTRLTSPGERTVWLEVKKNKPKRTVVRIPNFKVECIVIVFFFAFVLSYLWSFELAFYLSFIEVYLLWVRFLSLSFSFLLWVKLWRWAF